jgi:hypothetical protein
MLRNNVQMKLALEVSPHERQRTPVSPPFLKASQLRVHGRNFSVEMAGN